MTTLRTSFQQDGIVELSDFGDAEMWDALVREAAEREPHAEERRTDKVVSNRDGSLSSAQRSRSHRGGEAMRALSRSRELLARAREITGIPRLVPTICGYKYYRQGDFLGLHRDGIRCTVAFTFALTENMTPMYWRPELRGAGNDTICALVEEEGSCPAAGEPVPVEFCRLRGFDGYNIPHWRRPFEHDLGTIGAICYFDL